MVVVLLEVDCVDVLDTLYAIANELFYIPCIRALSNI